MERRKRMTSKVEMGLMMGNVLPAASAAKSGQNSQDAFQGIMFNMTTVNMTTPDVSVSGQNEPKAQNNQPEKTAAVKGTAGKTEDNASNGKTADTVSSVQETGEAAGSVQETEEAVSGGQKTEDIVSEDSGSETVVSEAEEDILTQTAEKLDITVEELEEILAQMGLNVWALLEPENVSALVAEVLGDGDKWSLVTDENLSQTVLELNASMKEIGAELAKELGVDEADVKAVLEGLPESPEEPKDAGAVMTMPKAETAAEIQTVREMPEAAAQTEYDEAEDAGEVQAVVEQLPADHAEENSGSSSSDTQSGQRGFGSDRMTDALMRRQTVREDQIGALQQTTPDTPVMQDIALEAARELMGSSPTEIIDQINAYIRQNTAAHITEWQMQLNPENLGTVSLNVTAKEGAVTAQFTTQNEAVKAVMEAQIMVLKENLEQQGVKVEAVEVTVASHEFEQNLQQGDESNRQMEEEQENLRKATRKIDLGEFASPEDLEALDEAEQVTVEMMQADGNMMDYKV